MKPISLMIAFEDGLVKHVTDQVSCAPFQRTSDPHGSGMKTMKQVIEQSSNPGIARVIFRGYEKDPARFHDRLAELGFSNRYVPASPVSAHREYASCFPKIPKATT